MEEQSLNNAVAELIKRRNELHVQINKHYTELSPLLEELKRIDTFLSGYEASPAENARYNWNELALECISRTGELLQTTDILERALGERYSNANPKKRKNMLVALSISLNNMCLSGTMRKVIVKGYKGHFYGLPDWFDNDGNGGLHGIYAEKLRQRTRRQHYQPVVIERDFVLHDDTE